MTLLTVEGTYLQPITSKFDCNQIDNRVVLDFHFVLDKLNHSHENKRSLSTSKDHHKEKSMLNISHVMPISFLV